MDKSVFLVRVLSRNNVYSRPWLIGERKYAGGTCFAVEYAKGDAKRQFLATNYHVVESAEHISVEREGILYDCKVAKTAPEYDLALLEPTHDFYPKCKFLEIATDAKKTDDVLIVGFPTNGYNMSINKGMISRFECTQTGFGFATLTLQVDVTSAPGNSGGPILRDGKVVGVHRGRIDMFALSTHAILLQQLITRQHDQHCSLHAGYIDTTPSGLQKFYGLTDHGVVLAEILKGNKGKTIVPFEPEDALLSINGINVGFDGRMHVFNDYISLHCYIMTLDPAVETPVEIMRKGKKMDLKMKFPQREDIVVRNTKLYRGDYVITMGLGFVAASDMYLGEIASVDRESKVNISRCYTIETVDNAGFEDGFDAGLSGRQQIVMLSDVIPDQRNRNYHAWNVRLRELNGIRVFNLQHVLDLCKSACGKLPFLKFKFDMGIIMTIDISDLKSADAFDGYNVDLCKRMLGTDRYYNL